MQVGRVTHIDTEHGSFAFSALADQIAVGTIVKVVLPDHDSTLALFALVIDQTKRITEQVISPSQRQQVDSGYADVWAVPFAYGDPNAMNIQFDHVAQYVARLRRMDIVVLCDHDTAQAINLHPGFLAVHDSHEKMLRAIKQRP